METRELSIKTQAEGTVMPTPTETIPDEIVVLTEITITARVATQVPAATTAAVITASAKLQELLYQTVNSILLTFSAVYTPLYTPLVRTANLLR